MEYKFREFIIGELGASTRKLIVPESDIESLVIHCQQTEKEAYHSVFNYSEDIVDYVQKNGSVKAYNGIVAINRIYIDIDNHGDEGHDLIYQTLDRLKTVFGLNHSDYMLWFSGRGYHIEMPNVFGIEPQTRANTILKTTLSAHLPDIDQAIYTKTSVIRAHNTINTKVNLYKILITFEQIPTAREYAERAGMIPHHKEWDKPHLTQFIIVPSKHRTDSDNRAPQITDDVSCIAKILSDPPVKGKRHQTMLRIAANMRRRGLPMAAAVAVCHYWARNELSESEVNYIVQGVYKSEHGYPYGCNDEILKANCIISCRYYRRRNMALTPLTSQDLERQFVNFTRSVRPLFHLEAIHQMHSQYRFYPGELVLFMGDTGLGKTAYIQNLVLNVKVQTLFFSLEVYQHLIFRRFIQISQNLSRAEVEQYYQTNNNSYSHGMDHIGIIAESVTIDDLKNLIRERDPKLVVIDTLERIHIPGKTEWNEKSEILAHALRDICNETGAVVIGIHHISKGASRSMSEFGRKLNVHDGKGASSLEQQADKVIGIEGEQNSLSKTIFSMKSRDEGTFTLQFRMNPKSFRYEQVIHQSQEQYGSTSAGSNPS